jgi:hypothetical protein
LMERMMLSLRVIANRDTGFPFRNGGGHPRLRG